MVAPSGVTSTLSDQGERPSPLFRVLGDFPVFRLHSLKPGREYQLLVYAVNAKGRSDPPVVLSKVKVLSLDNGEVEDGAGVVVKTWNTSECPSLFKKAT